MEIKPSFYDKFVCKAQNCKDTCCAGWEIDIDDVTLQKYKCLNDDFSQRLLSGINFGKTPNFKLINERCVFLNKKGLCDIYSNLGSDYLCDICAEHPRFYDEYDDVLEIGLGLCCEKVCELLFDDNYQLDFISDVNPENLSQENKILFLERNKMFDILKSDMNLNDKIKQIYHNALKQQEKISLNKVREIAFDKTTLKKMLEILADTEPINENWTRIINRINSNFDSLISMKKIEPNNCVYSKLMMYVIYRHFMKSGFDGNMTGPVMLALFAVVFVYFYECDCYSENNSLKRENIVSGVKLWSEQIEYCEENTHYCLTSYF